MRARALCGAATLTALQLYLALYLLANNPTHAPALAAGHQRNLDTFLEMCVASLFCVVELTGCARAQVRYEAQGRGQR